MIVLGGEQTPDAELMRLSTVPIGVAAQAHQYLAEGGAGQPRGSCTPSVSDTVLLTGEGFDPPTRLPAWGLLDRDPRSTPRQPAPRIGILYLPGPPGVRQHRVRARAGRRRRGAAPATPSRCRSSARPCAAHRTTCSAQLGTLDALVVTVLAAGGTNPATATAGGDDEAWDVTALAALDIPILQGLCLTWSREAWADSDEGLSPLDVATQVAVPEFDGRIITVPFSFKETDPPTMPVCPATSPTRNAAPGSPASPSRTPGCGTPRRRSARSRLMLSAYPTKHSRIGNAVGLDTPVSAIRLLRAMRDAGYDLGPDGAGALPGLAPLEPIEGEEPDTTAGNALIHALIAAGGQDEEWLTAEQLSGNPVRIPAARYSGWLDEAAGRADRRGDRDLGAGARASCSSTGPTDPDGEIVLATLQAGNVVVLIQPPRGFGENPVAIYHDPDMPPSHHYLATLPLAREGVRRARRGAPGQARQPGMAARQERRHVRCAAAPTPRSGRCR